MPNRTAELARLVAEGRYQLPSRCIALAMLGGQGAEDIRQSDGVPSAGLAPRRLQSRRQVVAAA